MSERPSTPDRTYILQLLPQSYEDWPPHGHEHTYMLIEKNTTSKDMSTTCVVLTSYLALAYADQAL